MEETKKCAKCGESFSGGAIQCPYCGSGLFAAERPPTANTNSTAAGGDLKPPMLSNGQEKSVKKTGWLSRLFGSKKNTHNCDKCGSPLSSPDGYLLDVQKERIEERRNIAQLAVKAGAAGVIANLSTVAFICERCLNNEASAQGRPVDSAIKLMSRARAMHLWNTGKFERPMFPDEFPPVSEEKRLPWMSAALEAEWIKDFGPEPSLSEYLAMRAEILARFLVRAAHRATLPKNLCMSKAAAFTVVIAEMGPALSWKKCVGGFMERRLLNSIGEATKVWFISYHDCAKTWFTRRLLPYVATSVANKLGQSLENLKYECYIDNKGRRCLTILG